ncbi:MAG: helix-turn-helix domain-containing protein [Planctomycetes bacterium]|nr:helix-turn-helix domain-containing protein [Planctomycetota bacterium]
MSPDLVNRLQAERSRRGLTQAGLARLAGISRAEVSAIETGRLRSPSVGAALALSAALEVPVEALFVRPGGPVAWAWDPPSAGPRRFWRARVGEQDLLYPVEDTLLGALAHDGVGPPCPTAGARDARTVVIAGCDPAVGLLAGAVARAAGVRVLAFTRSSARALDLLGAGKVHLAGVHLGDNAREARRALPRRALVLARVARWEAGLAVAPGVRARSVGAALRARLRWVSREEGSGAWRLLERLRAAEGVRRAARPERVARDHAGVAQAIRCGWAQLGPCVRLAAEEAGLDFLAVERQAYDLCTTRALADDPGVVAVLEALRAAPLRRLLGELPGYDAAECGAVAEVA